MAQILYAPIRKKYHEKPKTSDTNNAKCPFCDYKKHPETVVFEGNTAVIIANSYPYTFGHLLVIPKRHIKTVEELNKDEDKDVMLLIKRATKFLKDAFNAESFNLGLNQGPLSGGTVEHLHFHVVPRYKGDVGFTHVLNNTVIQASTPTEMVKELKQKCGLR